VEGRLIPRPEVPCYPIHSDLSLITPPPTAYGTKPGVGLFAISRPLFTTAGKTGLAWTFKALGLKPGTQVLVPSYHCTAMVEPLEWLNLKPLFYKLNEDLSIDYADLKSRLTKDCKALIAVHYFGFPQDGPRLRAFCDDAALALIEDCCHSFFGSYDGQALGSFGDFAVGSLPKFFPFQAGGCVVSSRRDLPREPLTAPGSIAEMQTLIRELQTAQYYGRLLSLRPITLAAAALNKTLRLAGLGRDMTQLQDSPKSLEFSASRLARNIQQACDPEQIASQRRHNYETISRSIADLPGVCLLKPQLAAGVVPYMIPLRIPALRQRFASFEDSALPMQRFGQFLSPDLDPAFCPVSSDLSHHGLQLPCHQNLQEEEILWIVERLADLCRINPKG
jgi:perosamine synthetase